MPAPSPLTSSVPTQPRQTATHTGSRRRTGKIARLPQHLQDAVNVMLQDGLAYAAILERLGSHAQGTNYHSLKRWRQGGYRDWLRAKERLEIARVLQHRLDPANLHSALAYQASLQMFQYLVDLEPSLHAQEPRPNIDTVVRISNAVPTLRRISASTGIAV